MATDLAPNSSTTNESCRVFLEDVEGTPWQLFSLSQNKRDGSIYLGSPTFGDYEWPSFTLSDGKPSPVKISQDEAGHISFHGLGQSHVRSENNSQKLVIQGQHLLKPESKEISLRHLFTVMPKQPSYVPASPALARKSDQLIKSSKPLHPFVAVAFAIPSVGLKINFSPSLHVDEMEEIPGSILGLVSFPLIYHDIVIFVYYTKHMLTWPRRNMLQYWDGVLVPIFKGRPNGIVQADFIMPTYQLNGNELTITLNMSGLPSDSSPLSPLTQN